MYCICKLLVINFVDSLTVYLKITVTTCVEYERCYVSTQCIFCLLAKVQYTCVQVYLCTGVCVAVNHCYALCGVTFN